MGWHYSTQGVEISEMNGYFIAKVNNYVHYFDCSRCTEEFTLSTDVNRAWRINLPKEPVETMLLDTRWEPITDLNYASNFNSGK